MARVWVGVHGCVHLSTCMHAAANGELRGAWRRVHVAIAG